MMKATSNLKILSKLSLEVQLPYEPVCRSVGRFVGRSVVISLQVGKLHFHAPFRALVKDKSQKRLKQLPPISANSMAIEK